MQKTVDLSRLPPRHEIEKEISRRECKRSFSEFVKQAWHVIEPSTPLKWGWAMETICQHLEAVTNGSITRLLMNVPPGTSKSTLVSVMWPAWEWIQNPQLRYISTAHKADLATRDNMKCRRLIQSDWYQSRFPIKLVGDQNAKTKFENSHTGFRESMAFVSMTGARGDRVILDDPLSADDANSEAALMAAERAFTETLPTRVNNEQSAIVVIMQRLSERDTSGLIIDRKLPYVHLNLPMRFEEENKCTTSIGFEDPRTEDGELLFPERFSETQVNDFEKVMGSYSFAGQMQQRPVPRSGGLFNREWLKTISAMPNNCKQARGWDLAATVKDSAAYTAGVGIAQAPSGDLIIFDVVRGKWSGNGVRNVILETAKSDGQKTRQSIPQDPGQSGKAQVSLFSQDLAGFDCRFSPESGDKITRALPIAAQAEAGNVYLLEGEWNKEFIDECAMFPNGKFKDQVDALSRAYSELLKMNKFNPKVASLGVGVSS